MRIERKINIKIANIEENVWLDKIKRVFLQ